MVTMDRLPSRVVTSGLYIVYVILTMPTTVAGIKTQFEKVSALVGVGVSSTSGVRVIAETECARKCAALSTCEQFAVLAESPSTRTEYQCSLDTEQEQLAPGTWTLYKMTFSTRPLPLYPDAPRFAAFVRRFDGSVDFNVPGWEGYKAGFGNSTGEMWLGLESLHNLTTTYNYSLRVDMEKFDNSTYWAEYDHFSVGPESDDYRLSVLGYNPLSTAGDSIENEDGMAFTTHDRDNDLWNPNCAVSRTGGWWYRACHKSKPTGTYFYQHTVHCGGINWKSSVTNSCAVYKTMQMAIVLRLPA